MESYKKRHYETVSLEVRLISNADVITASPNEVQTYGDGVMDVRQSWVE